jgi:hypothetical protein
MPMEVRNVETDLPIAGSISAEVSDLVHRIWMDEAAKAGVDLSGFDPDGPLVDRLVRAGGKGLQIGTALSRFSTKMQHRTTDQVTECVIYAARYGAYIPPEYVCVDEGVSGRKLRRDGLDRARFILEQRRAKVLFTYKVSRLFRVAYRGFQFFQEEVVEDPDSQALVTLEVRKTEGGYLVGIDGSYLEQDVGPVYDPCNFGVELEVSDDEKEGGSRGMGTQSDVPDWFCGLAASGAAVHVDRSSVWPRCHPVARRHWCRHLWGGWRVGDC